MIQNTLHIVCKMFNEILDENKRLENALREIYSVSFYFEETAWTWKDICMKQADIARAARLNPAQHER